MSRIKGVILSFGLFLTVSAAVSAGELPQISGSAQAKCAQNSSTLASLPDTLPAWLEATVNPCGPGCPTSGAGTDASCINKNVGDVCGTGATCMPFYTVACPAPNKRCICLVR
jgi:hypothetical protein